MEYLPGILLLPYLPYTGLMVRPHASYSSDWKSAGRCASGTPLQKLVKPARPKNLERNTVAWPCGKTRGE